MTADDAARQLERLARDLDLAVFALEGGTATEGWFEERQRLRRELESLRDRIEEIARALG